MIMHQLVRSAIFFSMLAGVPFGVVSTRSEGPPKPEMVEVVSTVRFEAAASEVKAGAHDGVFQSIDLEKTKFEESTSTPRAIVVSGRVISHVAGADKENIAIYVNSPLHAPRLAALTNSDGDFKFRLFLTDVDYYPHPRVRESLEGDLLLVRTGGLVPPTLHSGSAVRYRLTELKKFAGTPRPPVPNDN